MPTNVNDYTVKQKDFCTTSHSPHQSNTGRIPNLGGTGQSETNTFTPLHVNGREAPIYMGTNHQGHSGVRDGELLLPQAAAVCRGRRFPDPPKASDQHWGSSHGTLTSRGNNSRWLQSQPAKAWSLVAA